MNEEFITIVKVMRTAQRNYFATRKKEYLSQAKEFEKKVDKFIAEHDAKQPKLYNYAN